MNPPIVVETSMTKTMSRFCWHRGSTPGASGVPATSNWMPASVSASAPELDAGPLPGAPEVASAEVSTPDSPGAPLEVAAPVASLLGAPEVPTAASPPSDAVQPSADAVPANATPRAALGMRNMRARYHAHVTVDRVRPQTPDRTADPGRS